MTVSWLSYLYNGNTHILKDDLHIEMEPTLSKDPVASWFSRSSSISRNWNLLDKLFKLYWKYDFHELFWPDFLGKVGLFRCRQVLLTGLSRYIPLSLSLYIYKHKFMCIWPYINGPATIYWYRLLHDIFCQQCMKFWGHCVVHTVSKKCMWSFRVMAFQNAVIHP